MPNDILYDAAHAFSKMLEYDYHFILGDSKRQKTFSIISNEKDMFTHICGIDHLKDIPKVTAKKSSEKIAILKNILSKKSLTRTYQEANIYMKQCRISKIRLQVQRIQYSIEFPT